MTSLNDTSVSVSWTALIITGFPIDSYTVVYSPVSQDREMTHVVSGSVTSTVITGLDPSSNYQFQVFATVTVDGEPLEGERSMVEIRDFGKDSESERCVSSSSPTPIIIGVILIIIGTAVGVSGLIFGIIMFRRMR